MKRRKTILAAGAAAAVFGVFAALGGIAWFEFTPSSQTCAKCHEIRGAKESWTHAAHSEVDCKSCHGGSVEALGDNIRRVWSHITERDHSAMALSAAQVVEVSGRCAKCHAAEHAQWSRGGHGAPVSKFLMDGKHNAAWKPADNCLRCHGMFLEGDIEDILVREWPHRFTGFRDPAVASHPAIPCLACHRMHAVPPAPGSTNFTAAAVSLYSRPDRARFAPGALYAQRIAKDGAPVKLSADPRGRLCASCHAANAEARLGSCDDRTPVGVHEGIGCLACHRGHDMRTGETCGTCHGKCVKTEDSGKLIHGR